MNLMIRGKNVVYHYIQWLLEKNYIEKNLERMDYQMYLNLGLSIGSGVIERAIKYIYNRRLKNNSARRLLKNIKGLLKLRIIWFNNNFEKF
jgi:hypothetical protein